MPRIQSYDLHEVNGIRWWRIVFAPRDFLIDPDIWIKDTRVEGPSASDGKGRKLRIGPYLVMVAWPQLYFDHGKFVPPWIIRRFLAARRPN